MDKPYWALCKTGTGTLGVTRFATPEAREAWVSETEALYDDFALIATGTGEIELLTAHYV